MKVDNNNSSLEPVNENALDNEITKIEIIPKLQFQTR